MSDIDIRDRLEAAAQPAFGTAIDAEADLGRGRQSRRRRRARQVAAGTSAGAVAGAAVFVGLPLADDGGADRPLRGDRAWVPVSSGSGGGYDGPVPGERIGAAFYDHLGFALADGIWFGMDQRTGSAFVEPAQLYDDGESVAGLSADDDVRDGAEPAPLRCADDPAYDTCQRRTLDDGTEIVVGQGADDLLVITWGRGGDLVEVTAHWADAAEHNVTLDQLVELATDDRLWVD